MGGGRKGGMANTYDHPNRDIEIWGGGGEGRARRPVAWGRAGGRWGRGEAEIADIKKGRRGGGRGDARGLRPK